jgi:hypothetical protein
VEELGSGLAAGKEDQNNSWRWAAIDRYYNKRLIESRP